MVQAPLQPLTLSAPPGVPEGLLSWPRQDTTPAPKTAGRAAESVTDTPLQSVVGYLFAL